jgi:uncharacterized protein
MKDKRAHIVAFFSGLLFAIGLGVAGMSNPYKVLNFLDLFGDWDPSLALVMAGAILVYAPVYKRLKGKDAPKFAERFHWPTKQDIDVKLVVGSILFGIGWGTAGFCPGPAIVAVTSGKPSVLAFFAAMVLGMLGQRFVTRWRPAS